MNGLGKAILVIGGNALALWLADMYVPGFALHGNWVAIVLVALILSLLNFILKPILTLVLGPVIILTLGLGIIIVNALILYLLPIIANHIDFLRGSIMIQNIPALFWATLLISVVNFIIHLAL